MRLGETVPLPQSLDFMAGGNDSRRPAFASYFGLREHPFRGTSDPRFLLLTDQTRKALDGLVRAIDSRAGLLVLTGEVGSGKTVLLNALLDVLRQRGVPLAFLFNSHLGTEELIEMALAEFNAPRDPRPQLGSTARLHQWLLNCYRVNSSPVLIIDEAQGLKTEVLEAIRMLLNLETNGEKLLQTVLAGQPEFDTKIDKPELRQVRQRIAFRCRLRALTAEETFTYVEHRLRVAGAAIEPVFERDAIAAIHYYSRGIPRIINVLCEQSLMKAYSERCRPIQPRTIEEVAFDSQIDGPRPVGPPTQLESLFMTSDTTFRSRRADAMFAVSAGAPTAGAPRSDSREPSSPAPRTEPSVVSAARERTDVLLAMSAAAAQKILAPPQAQQKTSHDAVRVQPAAATSPAPPKESGLGPPTSTVVAPESELPETSAAGEHTGGTASPPKLVDPAPAKNTSAAQTAASSKPGREEPLPSVASVATGAAISAAPPPIPAEPEKPLVPMKSAGPPPPASPIVDIPPRQPAQAQVQPKSVPVAFGTPFAAPQPVEERRGSPRQPAAPAPVVLTRPSTEGEALKPSLASARHKRTKRTLSSPVLFSAVERLAASCLHWLREPIGSDRRPTRRKGR